ncbi:MAG: transporter substrate-binding domain-containing protein [Gammaproteobacteria bacterium]|nr:transporter substrate-binding domain-containing protein [Gammaproteobacteria bacterium]
MSEPELKKHPHAAKISIGVALLLLLVLVMLVWLPSSDKPGSKSNKLANADTDQPAPSIEPLPGLAGERYTTDLDGMRERGIIRALVVPSLTDFFSVEGRIRGVQAEMLEKLEEHLNKDIGRDEVPVRIIYVPVAFDDLIPALQEGRGDIAAAILTSTPERRKEIAFAGWQGFSFDEVLVHHEDVAGIESLDDLAGRKLYVLRNSSYAEHLRALNEDFTERGLEPMTIVESAPLLTSEDIMEMVHAEVVDITVVDGYKAELWGEALDDMVVRSDIVLSTDNSAGWGIRQTNKALQAEINAAMRDLKKGTLLGNILLKRYFGSTQFIDNPLASADREKLREYADLFRKYGDKYDIDWVALVAQAYQESGLDQSVRSPAGAIGMMQLLKSTAETPNVNIPDIEDLENNVHAGAKYMNFLRERYFADEPISEFDKLAFTWAAYNAGPRKLRLIREHAEKLGYDPNQWFGNVEFAALDLVGSEPVRYVANIYKYYVAYRLTIDLDETREALQEGG